VALEKNVAPAGYESLGISAPFTRTKFNFVMQNAASADEALPLTRMERVTTPT
jgi:catechol 1,2-dioxygenase